MKNDKLPRFSALRVTLSVLIALVLASCTATVVRESASVTVSMDTTMRSRDVDVPITWVLPKTSDAPIALAILIHGHGGTRQEAGGFVRLADRLAEAGIASIRMDFAGSGDSTEPFYKNSLTTMAADINAARDFAMSHAAIDADRIGLVGFSMGGRLAALETTKHDYKTMALWAPALINGAGDMVDMLGGDDAYAAAKQTAAEDGYVDYTTFWGQPQQLGLEWFVDLEQSRPMDAITTFTGSLLLVHGTADDVVPPSVSVAAETAASNATRVSRVMIDGADHGFGLFDDNTHFSDALLDATVTFLLLELQ